MIRHYILFALTAIAMAASAMPAHPGKRWYKLPDGTMREAILRGDEHCHWFETPQGLRLSEPECSMPVRKADVSTRRHAKSNPMLLDGCFPTTGKRKLLALLVNFADTRTTYSQQNFSDMMNKENYMGVGSFRDYYLQQSYGQLDIETTVTRWVTLSKNKALYSGDNVTNLIDEALRQLDSEINFADFDNDGDGVLDGLIVIHQGKGQEASADPNDIWSHSSTIYGMKYDGVTIYRYTIEPEILYDSQTTIGVVCHEFGHNLGALDYYDTDYSKNGEYPGTGNWDLMGSGAWNGPKGRGDYPAPFSAWQKIQFGWMAPTLLSETAHIDNMPSVSTTPVCYQMNTSVDGDYFILENRQKTTPWDFYCVGHGLLITHAIESILKETIPGNAVNAAYPQGLYTVAANATGNPVADTPSSYGNPDGTDATFPGTGKHTSFSDTTTPSCRSFDGRHTYASLEHIAESATGEISFDYILGNAPIKPRNLTTTVVHGLVHLTWDFPEDAEQPLYFTVYRNGKEIARVQSTEFQDEEVSESGLITYIVDATYASGLVSSYVTATTRIPVSRISELQADLTEENLTLTWKQPNEITRCTDNQKYEVAEHFADNMCYAHRYRPEDLLTYIGYKIRSISFIPMQTSNFASYKVCVWRRTTESHEVQLVSSRDVNEFSPTYKRTTMLTSQPVIEAGYEYFIGVQITSTNHTCIAVTDQSELIADYGNWMSLGSTAWQPDPAVNGNYIISAALVAPATPMVMTEAPLYTDYDAAIDLYYPLAYRIYIDDELTATTTATSCTLPVPNVSVAHTYSVVSLYKGDNESKPLSVSVVPEGITSTTVAKSHQSACYDLTGRRLSSRHRGIIVTSERKLIMVH